jgi:hypothetical protein
MADGTYAQKVYEKQGGDEVVVASGGAVTVESGGNIHTESGGTLTTAQGVGTANAAANVTAVEHGAADVIHKTVLTLAATPVSVVGAAGVGFGGVKCYDFPEGRILVLGSVADLTIDVSGDDISDTGSGDIGLGTVIVADADLGDATDVDLGPSTALTDPFVAGIGDAQVALAASAQFDGTATAKDANLNVLIDDADIAGTEVALFSGTWTLTWINLGDY